MSATATAPALPTEPGPAGRLLNLVHRLIEYGKALAATLRQSSVATDLAAAMFPFGTSDIAPILARITRGLQRANALEARLVRDAGRLDAEPRPHGAPAVAKAASVSRRQAAPPACSRLAHLPTPEQIAAEIRRRPIGAVIADICRDLGITPSHPLWRELQLVIIRHGGSLANLVRDIMQQVIQSPVPAVLPVGWPAWCPPPPSRAGTDPP